ncbi:uncharacterized protein LOC110033922 isoform X3 [Phalaenopsis equestris]|uniref:uncharacterized protein LOC110033922 isoform X3 n=1 Tax=Phalaenopsis equestris TaxID=78828 RepID=UPI0009E55FB6|nr:uncharacterized protein LOC110033922 isoform X3 [Phalaenopsis equestris]
MLSSPRVGFQNLPHVLSSASLSPLPRTAKSFCQRKPLFISSSKVEERGIEFETGDSFFRHESAVGRDLSVLAAALQRRSIGRGLRVIDAMCGCGVRSLRYLVQSEADFVWANDAFEGHRGLIASNLSSVVPRVSAEGGRRWVVTHYDANRLLAGRYLQGEYFDLVDVDSFGSDSSFIRSAIATVKIGGLLYCTSTDGFSSGGHRPQHNYGFISYCNQCGHSQTYQWGELGQISCPCRNGMVSHSVVVSGPLWIGPLHNTDYVCKMLELAREWGWACNLKKCSSLESILTQMIAESDPQLPPGYIKLDEIASRAQINSPPVSAILSALQKEGYAACRSHINPNAIKTNCPMAKCILIARELRDVSAPIL